MKKILVLLLILAIIAVGCQQEGEKTFEKEGDAQPEKEEIVLDQSQIKFKVGDETIAKIEAQQNEEGDIEIEAVEPTMEADAVEKTVDLGDEWCKKGQQWSFQTEQEGIDASADWEIQGIVDSGEYAGLCHVIYSAQTPLGDTTMDYYFTEDGESGYFEMKMPNGQTVKQEWHG
ncbi:hypothetical protein KY338_03780 [Candidatus Woesearchaeota archaeon]|nr:hypothetical protein [Candidatus Woesearchaeota archaeon]MBW3005432.1 hypothetical protein [Candidatus Woesearchaeota archaeon]